MLLPPSRRRDALDYRVVAGFTTGCVAGALLTGMFAWLMSGLFAPLSFTARMTALIVAALIVALAKNGPLSRFVALPESRRLIPAEVLTGNLVRGAFQFGAILGTGVRTYVPSPIPYILLAVIALAQMPLGAALSMSIAFGIGRALPLVAQVTPLGESGGTIRWLREDARLARAMAHAIVVVGVVALVA